MLFVAPALLLAACSGGDEKGAANNAAAAQEAAAAANRPAPTTPQLNVQDATAEENWIAPQNGASDPKSAPYGNILSEPVVNAPSKPK